MKEKLFVVSCSPHIKSKVTTRRLMGDVAVALLPALFAGIYFFGWRVALLSVVCVGGCVGSEALYNILMKKEQSAGDLSSVVTGLLLVMNLPVTAPVWMALLGSVFAIVITKMLFGGLGQNFMNPALSARVLLMVSFPSRMAAGAYLPVDATTSATPMTLYKTQGEISVGLWDLFWGNGVYGSIGEVCKAALLLGAAYLLIKKVISPVIPFVYIGAFGAIVWAFGGNVAFQLLAGGLILGAFFMATDYVTSPVTLKGKVIYALMLAILTFVLRTYGAYAEGVCFAILMMNALSPLIDRFTKQKPFGKGGKPVEKNA